MTFTEKIRSTILSSFLQIHFFKWRHIDNDWYTLLIKFHFDKIFSWKKSLLLCFTNIFHIRFLLFILRDFFNCWNRFKNFCRIFWYWVIFHIYLSSSDEAVPPPGNLRDHDDLDLHTLHPLHGNDLDTCYVTVAPPRLKVNNVTKVIRLTEVIKVIKVIEVTAAQPMAELLSAFWRQNGVWRQRQSKARQVSHFLPIERWTALFVVSKLDYLSPYKGNMCIIK